MPCAFLSFLLVKVGRPVECLHLLANPNHYHMFFSKLGHTVLNWVTGSSKGNLSTNTSLFLFNFIIILSFLRPSSTVLLFAVIFNFNLLIECYVTLWSKPLTGSQCLHDHTLTDQLTLVIVK